MTPEYLELMTTVEKEYTLLVKVDWQTHRVMPTVTPYIVAWRYNRPTQDWAQGHYFSFLEEALDFIRS